MTTKDSEIGATLLMSVLEDDRLQLGSRVLYAIICGLSVKSGYCFATNAYFGERIKVSERTISRWLGELVKYKYITIQLHTKDHVSDRHIVPIGPMPARRSADAYAKRGGTEGRTYEPRPYVDKRLYWEEEPAGR